MWGDLNNFSLVGLLLPRYHGADLQISLQAMQRDIKLNNKQYTKKQCEKKINLLLEKYSDLVA